jgi:hypothetical protein
MPLYPLLSLGGHFSIKFEAFFEAIDVVFEADIDVNLFE